MKKATNRILSFLTAFAMVLGVLVAPFASANASGYTEPTGRTKVVIHKMELSSLDDFKPNGRTEGLDGTKYDGGEIKEQSKFFQNDAKEVEGVPFVVYNITKDDLFETIQKDPASYNTIKKMDELIAKNGENITKNEAVKTTDKGAELTLDKGNYWIVEDTTYEDKEGRTMKDGVAVPFGLKLPMIRKDGTYFTEENPLHVYPKNTFEGKPSIDKNFRKDVNKDAEGRDRTNNTASDTELDDRDGNPGNKRDKNTVSRNIGDTVPYQVETKIPTSSKFNQLIWTDTMSEGLTLQDGFKITIANITNEEEDAKGKKTYTTDEAVTLQPEHYTLISDDRGFVLELTEAGLKFVNERSIAGPQLIRLEYDAKINKDVKIDELQGNDVRLDYRNTPGFKKNTPPEFTGKKEIEYKKNWAADGNEVTEADKDVKVTFTLQVKEGDNWVDVDSQRATIKTNFEGKFTGLDEKKTYRVVESEPQGYEPEYLLTKDGKVVIVNNKNTTTPVGEKITVRKTWDGGKAPEKAAVVWTLYKDDAVFARAISRTGQTKEIDTKVAGTKDQTVKFIPDGNVGGTFTNLPEGSYRVEEKSGYYTGASDVLKEGEVKVKNYKTPDQPEPLNPSEPKVVTHGKRFVKTDNDDESKKLAGATFVVKKGKNQYLQNVGADDSAYKAANEAYNAAVKAYNEKVAKNETPTDEEKQNVDKLLAERDAAWRAYLSNLTTWKTVENADAAKLEADNDLVKLVSDEKGQFEIAGLEAGDYSIVEVKAPEGYALMTNEIKFNVGDGTYAGDAKELDYEFIGDDNQAQTAKGQKVGNKQVTIPQTGGIGSLIFIVAGLAVMAVAFIGMRRRNAYEA